MYGKILFVIAIVLLFIGCSSSDLAYDKVTGRITAEVMQRMISEAKPLSVQSLIVQAQPNTNSGFYIAVKNDQDKLVDFFVKTKCKSLSGNNLKKIKVSDTSVQIEAKTTGIALVYFSIHDVKEKEIYICSVNVKGEGLKTSREIVINVE